MMIDRINGRWLAAGMAIVVLVAAFLVFTRGSDTRTLTAHFPRAVSIYKGSEVRVMGVKIGKVTAVIPQGDSVRVDMSYDGEYKLPANAGAAIVTPTLVADRFVQITPAYTSGAVMVDGGDIPLSRSASPIELDRIYRSLSDLSTALGPNGANKNGALDSVLSAGANALRGKGKLANQTLLNLSAAVQTFGNNSGPLFDSIRQLAELTQTLAANDDVVNKFMASLAGVSSELAGERGDLQSALAALARAVGVVRTFVHDNKGMVESDVKELSTVLGTVAKEQKALGIALQLGPLGLNNLALAFDPKTGSIGSRVQVGPSAQSLGNILCDVITNAGVGSPAAVCALLKQITNLTNIGTSSVGAGRTTTTPDLGNNKPTSSLGGLLGGAS
jgi:phospholipid/cholesterol/gamma-HCH transport system substrate-binding protein